MPATSGRPARWPEDAFETLLATEDADVLFVAGCEENHGRTPDELRRVLDDILIVEPLLRRVAHHEARTTVPLNEVVATVLRLVDA